jgi:hypothetical protein
MARLRKDNTELLAFKRSIDLYFSSTGPFRDPRRGNAAFSESISTFNDFSASPSHTNQFDPAPSFLRAALLLG